MLLDRYKVAGRRVLLTISRLYERKGIDRVIEALPDLVQQFPDLVYLIVGDGYYRDALDALVIKHGVGDHVVFAGSVSDAELPFHYAIGDVFIMPNRELPDGETEGFGLVFLEANACGLPVIAGAAGGSVDAVQHRKNGIVVDGNDLRAISQAVADLLGDRSLYTQIGHNALQVAAASGWQVRVAEFMAYSDAVRAEYTRKV
jgi:phosphatidylinositol alpha-1,6-mannosyltransferase